MRIAFIVYDDLTLLDFAGAYDPVTRLKTMGFLDDLEYDVCAMGEKVKSFEGLELIPNKVHNNLSVYDYIFIPGGNGVMKLFGDKDFMSWIKGVSSSTIVTAVCGGALVLGAAGFLSGKQATTHPEFMKYLYKFTDKVKDSRIVSDGNVITARGVTSAVDLGLYLCERIAGKEAREKIQKQMDYLSYTCD
ncbi:MAG: DJ-1/PfpI family protein [Bacillota bacterium]|nr:DJ-1/PfpI family protein [Bacillota bacterium]